MLRDDSADPGRRRSAARNALGGPLDVCSIKPMTGFYRDGCCNTGQEDVGSHTVCAVMTSEFLPRKAQFRHRRRKIDGVYVRHAGRKQSRQVKRHAWFCVPLTRAPWLTARSPISNRWQWTWRDRGNDVRPTIFIPGRTRTGNCRTAPSRGRDCVGGGRTPQVARRCARS
jgi:Uncharacterized protein conserved in bacteria (DUF2237)